MDLSISNLNRGGGFFKNMGGGIFFVVDKNIFEKKIFFFLGGELENAENKEIDIWFLFKKWGGLLMMRKGFLGGGMVELRIYEWENVGVVGVRVGKSHGGGVLLGSVAFEGKPWGELYETRLV